jgi:hypothetical protein
VAAVATGDGALPTAAAPLDGSGGAEAAPLVAAVAAQLTAAPMREHRAALGLALGSARHTLLLLPAADHLEAAIGSAERLGLAAPVAAALRGALPYRNRAEEEAWLRAAAAAVGLRVSVERVAGAAQSAALKAGHSLLVVRRAAASADEAAGADAAGADAAGADAGPAAPTAEGAAAAGALLLSSALALRLQPAERCRLRALLASAPLREDMREAAQGWRVLGGAVRPAAEDGADLARWLGSAPALLDALQAAARALRQRGACDDPRSPTVLRAPSGAAAQAGACAAPVSGLAPSLERLRREVTCPRKQPVLCGDGVCRRTFLHCAAPQLGMDLTRLLRLGCHSS